MPPKAPAPPPPPRLDLPSALAILANPPDAASGGDPLLLPQALSFLGGLNFTTIPQVQSVATVALGSSLQVTGLRPPSYMAYNLRIMRQQPSTSHDEPSRRKHPRAGRAGDAYRTSSCRRRW